MKNLNQIYFVPQSYRENRPYAGYKKIEHLDTLWLLNSVEYGAVPPGVELMTIGGSVVTKVEDESPPKRSFFYGYTSYGVYKHQFLQMLDR